MAMTRHKLKSVATKGVMRARERRVVTSYQTALAQDHYRPDGFVDHIPGGCAVAASYIGGLSE